MRYGLAATAGLLFVVGGTITEPLAVPPQRYSDLRLFAAYAAYGFVPATEAERALRPLP